MKKINPSAKLRTDGGRRRTIRLAVLMGGQSSEHEISLATGKMVAASLNRDKYRVLSVVISKKGEWRFDDAAGRGFQVGDALKELKKRKIGLVFIALHGPFGEDGRIQALLEMAGLPYTGSGVMTSAVAMDKVITKKILEGTGVLMPGHVIIEKDFTERDLEKIKLPVVVKPIQQGSSVGISIVEKESELPAAIREALTFESKAMAEEFIRGREITAAVLGNKKPRALPLVEIRPKVSHFFDYRAKYEAGGSEEICPAPIGGSLTKKIQDTAVEIHRVLGCRGVTRSDFILKKEKPYFLEINTIPGMTKTSLVPQAAEKAGLPFPGLLDELVRLALLGD